MESRAVRKLLTNVVSLLQVLSFVLSEASGYLPYLSGAVEDPTGQWDGRKVHIFWSASIICESARAHVR